MRPLVFLCAALASLCVAGPVSAAGLPESGFVVFKDLRSYALVEVRDKATGRVVASAASLGEKSSAEGACSDSRHKFTGAYWHAFEPYLVNSGSAPKNLNAAAVLADLQAGHDAWESPFATDCGNAPGSSDYRAIYGGSTKRQPSLANLAADGANVVAFQSLAGTICDGAFACVVIDYKGGKINEADFALERDLTRYGYQDYWSTDDSTWFDSAGGRFAVIDVATHEWGHFAGLDHVEKSPALTMYPFIHDGMQTLGLGDMHGIVARY